ncbi:MAG: hypothetical protein CVV50_05400, partial [Spirochaetae bacterium HGW-Spirochaetae-6]
MLDFDVIPIPVDFAVPPVNAVIIFDEPLTVLDPGPRQEKTFALLDEALKSRGKNLKNVKRILLTHTHVDHFGGAAEIVRLSGAEVFVHPDDAAKARLGRNEKSSRVMKKFLLSHGVPGSYTRYIDLFFEKSARYQEPLEKISFYPAEIPFSNGTLRVHHTPGHTPGGVVFYEEASKTLFSGDTLLEHITPNPVFEENEAGERFPALMRFRETLGKLSAFDFKLIVPGHGGCFSDFAGLKARYLSGWVKRAQKILCLISEQKEITAYELARLL